MPLPPAYNYNPTLQPSAWWSQAQQKIPGLPGLPQPGGTPSALSTAYEGMVPYQSALSNLYQQSMAAPGVGQMTQEGAEPTAIPTEAGGSALAELLSSYAGVSRSSTTPLAGTPGQIGETQYSYNGQQGVMPVDPNAPTGGTGGWAVETTGTPVQYNTGIGTGSSTGTGTGTGGTTTPPAGGGGTGTMTQAGPGYPMPPTKEETTQFWDPTTQQYVTLVYNPATGQWQ